MYVHIFVLFRLIYSSQDCYKNNSKASYFLKNKILLQLNIVRHYKSYKKWLELVWHGSCVRVFFLNYLTLIRRYRLVSNVFMNQNNYIFESVNFLKRVKIRIIS